MKKIQSIFISQSYMDAWDDYKRSINRENFARWDVVALTASNDQQAEGFRMQIDERLKAGWLPQQTRYMVVPDVAGKRVGSGGATLNVLRAIARELGPDFHDKRILVIHSGGDSKRVPQYSALGKLFSPVPHELESGRSSTLFDELIIGMSSLPCRIKEGMVLLSGDVMLLFNALQIDYSGRGAACISIKEQAETGKNHGVFLRGADGNVAQFLHKQSVETLREKGAVNENGNVDIDTGAIIFSADMVNDLYGLVERDFDKFVNEKARLSLYGDFLYPLATDSTLKQFYKEKPDGDYCQELTAARTEIWQLLRPYCMKLISLSPAKFVHFGTTAEIVRLLSEDIDNYEQLGWRAQVNSSVAGAQAACYDSIISRHASVGQGSYIEASYVHGQASVGQGSVVSSLELTDQHVPDGVVLHGLKQKNGRFVCRIYGVTDNPKETLEDGCSFLGTTVQKFMDNAGVSAAELFAGASHALWDAMLYPECDTMGEAVDHAINIYEIAQGRGQADSWRVATRRSLAQGFNDADARALMDWHGRMRDLVGMGRLRDAMESGVSVEECAGLLQGAFLTKNQQEWLSEQAAKMDFSQLIRMNYYIGCCLGGAQGDAYVAQCFKGIAQGILAASIDSIKERDCRIARDEHLVELPLRVNWGGGWSDTPPYPNELGGTVLNAAISFNGSLPVHVALKRLDRPAIIFESKDMDSYGEFTDLSQIQSYGDPFDPFALQKAALLTCGIVPMKGSNMEAIFEKLGGGIYMETEVTGVPKGSGLGTSSILAGACVKALFEFMGIDYELDDLYDHVLCMEQLMSTGGGWQDQIGGLTPGVKIITSEPGMHQHMQVRQLELSLATRDELNQRFAIIYTGQRRLARNLLRDVVGRYIGNVPEALEALQDIQALALEMAQALEKGDLDEFSRLLSAHWEQSKKLDAGSTNTCIDLIFSSIEDLIDGRMICGAGGGGFLQVMMKKDVTRAQLQQRLREVFEDSGVAVWDCEVL